MNREIKFRAIRDDISKSEFVYGGLVYDTSTNKPVPRILTNDKLFLFTTCIEGTEGQYTGLKDKNGKEIYEGDILSYKSAHPKHDGKTFNNIVEFATGQSLCGWRMRNGSCVVKATPYKFMSSEIVGNIHQNPELLKP